MASETEQLYGFAILSQDNASYDGEYGSSESEEDYENLDYQDLTAKAHESYRSIAQGLKRSILKIKLLDGNSRNKDVIKIRGKFDPLFCKPWWTIRVEAERAKAGTKLDYECVSLPSYSARTDGAVDSTLIRQFMTDGFGIEVRDAEIQHVNAFIRFMKGGRMKPDLTKIYEYLGNFGEIDAVNKNIAEQLRKRMENCASGKAMLVPGFTQYAHRLFPRHVRNMLQKPSKDKPPLPLKTIVDIAKAIQEEPWTLGFQNLVKDRYRIFGCEASLKSFEICNLLENMEKSKREALEIYDALKKKIKKYKDTYVPLWRLKKETNCSEAALKYLRAINVIGPQEFLMMNGYRTAIIYLKIYKKYERQIAEELVELIRSPTRQTIVYVNEKDFNGDEYQLTAAQLIAANPVVVMSGKGGCGKTHVVSKLFGLGGAHTESNSCIPETSSNPEETAENQINPAQPAVSSSSIVPQRTGVKQVIAETKPDEPAENWLKPAQPAKVDSSMAPQRTGASPVTTETFPNQAKFSKTSNTFENEAVASVSVAGSKSSTRVDLPAPMNTMSNSWSDSIPELGSVYESFQSISCSNSASTIDDAEPDPNHLAAVDVEEDLTQDYHEYEHESHPFYSDNESLASFCEEESSDEEVTDDDGVIDVDDRVVDGVVGGGDSVVVVGNGGENDVGGADDDGADDNSADDGYADTDDGGADDGGDSIVGDDDSGGEGVDDYDGDDDNNENDDVGGVSCNGDASDADDVAQALPKDFNNIRPSLTSKEASNINRSESYDTTDDDSDSDESQSIFTSTNETNAPEKEFSRNSNLINIIDASTEHAQDSVRSDVIITASESPDNDSEMHEDEASSQNILPTNCVKDSNETKGTINATCGDDVIHTHDVILTDDVTRSSDVTHSDDVTCVPDGNCVEGSMVWGSSEDPTPAQEELVSIGPILLTAPTGKAATVLHKRTSLPAYTLHYVFQSYFGYLERITEKWKFSEVKILICDECSLISVKNFHSILTILTKHAKLCKIVLIGDINQLPSIEPGNFFQDVFQALETMGLCVTLMINHRAESQLIVDNARGISEQRMPVFPDNESLGFISRLCKSGRVGGKRNEDLECATLMAEVKKLLPPKGEEGARMRHQGFVLPDPDKSQFIAFERRICKVINELCAQAYQGHSIREKGKRVFQVGDKVCIRKNQDFIDERHAENIIIKGNEERKAQIIEERKKGHTVRLCNGEIFMIKDDIESYERQKKVRKLVLDREDGMTFKIDFAELKNAKLDHAWARTIHTFQGSEMETVVYVASGCSYQDWQHVYTAVTRGRKHVIIIHNRGELESIIHRKPLGRNTRLKEFLLKADRFPGGSPVATDTRLRDMYPPFGYPSVSIGNTAKQPPNKVISSTQLVSVSNDTTVVDDKTVVDDQSVSTLDTKLADAEWSQDGDDACDEAWTQCQKISQNTAQATTEPTPDVRPRKRPSTDEISMRSFAPDASPKSTPDDTSSPIRKKPTPDESPIRKTSAPDNSPTPRRVMLARRDSKCQVCHELIRAQVDQITLRLRSWVHVSCADKKF